MATLRQINRRIRSIQTTAKTTRAMSLVAGSKMRHAQMMALAHRPYAEELGKMLSNVVASIQAAGGLVTEGDDTHPLLARREVRTAGMILVTSDRGLAGGLNTNLIRAAAGFVTTHPGVKMITVGRKGNDFYSRTRTDIIGHFSRLGDYPSFDDVRPIARLVSDSYIAGEIDSVVIAYPRFVNTVVQRPELMELLPLTPPDTTHGPRPTEYIYEPDATSVLAALLPRYVEIQVYRAILELAASFQSAQMVAMRNATDAANDMISGLTLVRNKVRQEQITKELLDITGGVEALNAS